MPTPTPDLAGYQAAQERLMDTMGSPIVLLMPLPTVWPAGTDLDPESGLPRDPWVTPVSSGYASAACSGAVAYRVAYRRFESEADAEGSHLRQPGALVIRNSDYERFGSAATRAYVNGEYVDIYKWVPSGPAGTIRWLSLIQERE